MQPSIRATEAVRACVRSALRAEAGLSPGFRWPADLPPDDFLGAVRRQRVTQVIADHLDRLNLPDAVGGHVLDDRERETFVVMLQARELTRICRTLEESGVGVLAFKGPALAVLSTGRIDGRGLLGDIDILVAPEQVAEAHRALSAAGWVAHEPFPTPGPSWAWRHLLACSYEMPFVGEHSQVDLHWGLAPTRSALPDFDSVWSRRVPLVVAGTDLVTLGPADTFAHSCSHAAKDDWRWLRSLVDVHRLARDPDLWRDHTPSRVQLMSLAATRSTIGLPDPVPPGIHRQLDRFDRVVRRARRQQELPFTPRDPARFPGAGVPNWVRSSVRGGRRPGDVARVVGQTLVPATMAADLPDERAVTAVPKVMGRRTVRYGRKVSAWWRRA